MSSTPIRPAPRFAIVTAVYNVAAYLPDFLDSLEAQTCGLSNLEIVLVNDGSTDGSETIAADWVKRHSPSARLLSQPNAGQGAARNAGLALVKQAEWVTFTDPDDVLDKHYFQSVADCLDRWPSADMVAGRKLLWYEDIGLKGTTHPQDHMYDRDQLIDISRNSDFFSGAAPSNFFRCQRIAELGLTFDGRIRPNFEDGHFCVRYLLATPSPQVVFARSAVYHYRKRSDGSSTMQTAAVSAARFTVVPRLAYLADLMEGQRLYGQVPVWLQNLIIYELSWYFSGDQAAAKSPTTAFGAVAEQFIATLKEIAALLDPAVVAAFSGRPLTPEVRDILRFGLRGHHWAAPYAVLTRRDPEQAVVRITHRHIGRQPHLEFRDRLGSVEPVATKTRSLVYFDHTLAYEQIIWLRQRAGLTIMADGAQVKLVSQEPPAAPSSAAAKRAEKSVWGALSQATETLRQGASPKQITVALWNAAWAVVGNTEILVWLFRRRREWLGTAWSLVRSLVARVVKLVVGRYSKYDQAWVLIDWLEDADDNAERLFRYLRANRPDINAWFVINRGTPDWRKLRHDGFGPRLVAYGSWRWLRLMVACKNLVSSSANADVMNPMALWWVPKSWKYTFLQHGVIKDDISRWLNQKLIDLFVTSTPAEHESIVADSTPYAFTEHEVKRVGLARFDRLGRLGAQRPVEQQDLVLLTPTWRQDLSAPAERAARGGVVANLGETEFARHWLGLLRHPGLAEAVKAAGKHLAFLPHPNLQPILDSLDIPSHVRPIRFGQDDIQAILARCAVMVTDYSSMAFNAGFLGRPVVYFQFDAEAFFSGVNASRPGYFDYQRDGFGPVANSIGQVSDAVTDLLTNGPGIYSDRMDQAFATIRDGQCCRRTVAAIEALTHQGQ